MGKIGESLREPFKAFGVGPEEQPRMGQLAGLLWIAAAGITGVAAFLPGANHGPLPWLMVVCSIIIIYGLASASGLIRWERASIRTHAYASLCTYPLIAATIYLTGNASSYVEPLLVVPLFYGAFFFPRNYAWMLSLALMAVAGLPLLTDPDAIQESFLPRYLALCVAFSVVTWAIVGLKERLTAAEARQRAMANTDHLTGVGNRRTFDRRLRQEIIARTVATEGRREADHSPLVLLFFDLDDFKEINDRLGHLVGDAVLTEVARVINGSLRAEDTLARIGGDEFAVIAPGAGSDRAKQMAASIREKLGADRDQGLPRPGISVGWAVFPDDGQDFVSLQQTADTRMLEEKRKHQTQLRSPV